MGFQIIASIFSAPPMFRELDLVTKKQSTIDSGAPAFRPFEPAVADSRSICTTLHCHAQPGRATTSTRRLAPAPGEAWPGNKNPAPRRGFLPRLVSEVPRSTGVGGQRSLVQRRPQRQHVPGGAILKVDIPAAPLSPGTRALAITIPAERNVSYWFQVSTLP